ncbi:MAG: hypothetical protein D6797_01060 [Bdellovibrio sp.]|nr:MAG: hypothetical protein D6797_01060 [Bdellovibrio sp.]
MTKLMWRLAYDKQEREQEEGILPFIDCFPRPILHNCFARPQAQHSGCEQGNIQGTHQVHFL